MKADQSQGSGWVAVQFALLALQLIAVLTKRGERPGAVSRLAGGVLMAVAAGFALLGARSLGRNLTPLPAPKADGELVTTGIYARVRHPLYTSLMLGGFGWALLWRSVPALLLAAVQAVFLREKAKDEEKRLHVRFHDYATYASHVPPFLPRFISQTEQPKTR